MANPPSLRIKDTSGSSTVDAINSRKQRVNTTGSTVRANRPTIGASSPSASAKSNTIRLGARTKKADDERNFDGSVDAMDASQERSQIRKLTLIVSALTIFLIIALGYAVWVTFTTQADVHSMSADAKDVYVAKTDISPGTVIDESMLTLDSIPSRYVTSEAGNDLSDIVGKVAITKIAKQSQVDSTMVYGSGNHSKLATAIDKDGYAVTISVSSETGVAGLLNQGDYVDIYCLTGADDGVQGATLVMSNVCVVALDSSLSNNETSAYSTITLSIPTQADVTRILEMKQRGTLVCVLHATDVNILNAQGKNITSSNGVQDTLNNAVNNEIASQANSRRS